MLTIQISWLSDRWENFRESMKLIKNDNFPLFLQWNYEYSYQSVSVHYSFVLIYVQVKLYYKNKYNIFHKLFEYHKTLFGVFCLIIVYLNIEKITKPIFSIIEFLPQISRWSWKFEIWVVPFYHRFTVRNNYTTIKLTQLLLTISLRSSLVVTVAN